MTRFLLGAISWCALLLAAGGALAEGGVSARSLRWCTQVAFANGLEVRVDMRNNRLLYRRPGASSFTPAPLRLRHPHALCHCPGQGWYVANTEAHEILLVDSLERGRILARIQSIAACTLARPHDVLYNPGDGYVYVLNPRPVTLLRFRSPGVEEGRLDLSRDLRYARAICQVDGRVYVVGSATGRVAEILDFSAGTYRLYRSPEQRVHATAGVFSVTGLVPNGLAFLDGWWYVSSYFIPEMAEHGEDFNRNRLIRFRTWNDFEDGRWQDMSALLPPGLVPYFLTAHQGVLYVPLFNHGQPSQGDQVMALRPPLTPPAVHLEGGSVKRRFQPAWP